MLVAIIWVMTMGDDYVNYETTFKWELKVNWKIE